MSGLLDAGIPNLLCGFGQAPQPCVALVSSSANGRDDAYLWLCGFARFSHFACNKSVFYWFPLLWGRRQFFCDICVISCVWARGPIQGDCSFFLFIWWLVNGPVLANFIFGHHFPLWNDISLISACKIWLIFQSLAQMSFSQWSFPSLWNSSFSDQLLFLVLLSTIFLILKLQTFFFFLLRM